MTITYSETKDFKEEDIKELFSSVGWESARYSEKIVKGMKNSTCVVSAWDGKRLVGLARALSDGQTVSFLHYILVNPAYQGKEVGDGLMKRILERLGDVLYVKIIPSNPKTIPFYEKYGFKQYDNYSAMVIKRL